MDSANLLFLIPYLISLSISAGVGIYTWQRRVEIGAAAYALVALSQASWTLGYCLELLSPGLEGKIFWDNFQFIGGAGWAIALLVFTLQYTGRSVPRPWLTYSLLSLPLIVIVPLAFTDYLHHLIRPQARLVLIEPFAALLYDFTPLMWAWAIYGYIIVLTCFILLIQKYAHTHRLYRTQAGLVVAGNLIPIAGSVLTLTGVIQIPHRDITPFTFAIGNIVVAWGLFRYRLFDIVPVAREAVLENMQDAVFVVDAQQRIVDLNPAAYKAINHNGEAIIGQSVESVFSAWPELLRRYRDIEQPGVAEIKVKDQADYRHIELRLQPLYDRHHRLAGRLAIVRDITDLKLVEATLRQRTAELEAANEHLRALSLIKDEFVANTSHELRTPLTNINLYLNLLAANPEKRDAYTATLQREAERLENMIESLLALSRLDQNQEGLHLAPVDLNSLIREYVTDRALLAADKNLTLTVRSEEPLPVVSADENMIGQVISILLTNAINYTPVGGQILVSTQTETSETGQWAGFSVADTGPGIPAAEQDLLFTRFFRGHAGHDSEISGTGLGLALAKEIMDQHHGRIDVKSEGVPGQGAVFTVFLPATGNGVRGK